MSVAPYNSDFDADDIEDRNNEISIFDEGKAVDNTPPMNRFDEEIIFVTET